MKFFIIFNEILYLFYKTALFIAVENEYVEIVQFLLEFESIDANALCILKLFILNKVLYQMF